MLQVSDPMRWIVSIYLIFPATLGPGVYSASNRNEYQKQKSNILGWQPYRHLWADCIDNEGSLTSHNPIGLQVLLQGYLYIFLYTVWDSTLLYKTAWCYNTQGYNLDIHYHEQQKTYVCSGTVNCFERFLGSVNSWLICFWVNNWGLGTCVVCEVLTQQQ
jgi:hypothetical protein